MKQFLVAALLCAALAAADKRPFQRGQSFAFQRQTDGSSGAPEDLSPPPPGASAPPGAPAAPGGDAGGPYPPSGQPESGPYPPSGWKPQGQRLELPARQKRPPENTYGAPPKQPQQQYGSPPKQPQQQYGAPPKQPQQQYGAPPAPAEAPESAEPATESPDVVASNRLRNQLRQQRVILQRMRQVVRNQQQQLEQQRQEQQALLDQLQRLQQLRGVVGGQQQQEPAAQGQYVVNLPDGRVQRVQYANTPSSTSVFQQDVHQQQAAQAGTSAAEQSPEPPTYVARLQFMDVPPINGPVFSYPGSAPLVRVA